MSTLLSYIFSRDQFGVSYKQNQIGQAGIFDFLEKPRPAVELTSSIKGEYTICKDLTDMPMGITTSANGPTHREVLFPFACFPRFMISVPFVLNHYCSKYWYKNSLLLINPWLRKLKPVNIPILFSRSTVVSCNTKTGSKG